jgi:glucose/arabinose dehydrogenase
MQKKLSMLVFGCMVVITANCQLNNNTGNSANATIKTAFETIDLPAPYATPSVRNNSKVIGWPEGKTPILPAGFRVTLFAKGLDNPRWMYVAPNDDIFVSEANTISDGFAKTNSETRTKSKSNNSILLFRDGDHDGIPELKKVF